MVAPINRSSAVFSYLRTSVHRQCAGIRILDEDPKTYYRFIAKATFVDVKMKWIRDRGLDHAVEKEKHLKQLIALKNLIKWDPSGRLPVSIASEKKDELGLPTRAIKFIRTYPSVFQEIPDAFSGRLLAVRLTEEAARLDEEEQRLFDNNQQDCADRLLKLLMMTREKRLPLKIIDELRWDLGLPDDHIHRLVLNYPDYFEIVNFGPPRNLPGLEVVCWSRDLAVSVLEKNATNAITGESYRKGMPLSFPMSFPNGYDLEKKVKRWVEGWQKLPYISPYENASHLDPKSDLGEKWVVGVLHELFHLFISKKTERKNVLLLGEHLGFRPRFARAFAHHPGIFYSSNKIKTSTIVLREAYKRDLLLQKHPLFGMRFQYISLMKKSQTGTKSTVGLNPSESSGEEDDENEADQAQDEDTCFSSEDENSTESEGDRTQDSFASNRVAMSNRKMIPFGAGKYA